MANLGKQTRSVWVILRAAALFVLTVPSAAQAAGCPTPQGLYVTPGSERGVTRLDYGKQHGIEYVRIGGSRYFVDEQAHQMPESTVSYEAKCRADTLIVEMNVAGRIRKLVLNYIGGEGDLQVTVQEGADSMKVLYKPYRNYLKALVHVAESCPRYNRRFVTQGGQNDGRGVNIYSVPATTGMIFTVDKREFKVNGKVQQLNDMRYVASCVDKNVFINIFDKTDLLYTSLRYEPIPSGNLRVTEIDSSFYQFQYSLRTDIKEKEEIHPDYSDEDDED